MIAMGLTYNLWIIIGLDSFNPDLFSKTRVARCADSGKNLINKPTLAMLTRNSTLSINRMGTLAWGLVISSFQEYHAM